MADQQMPQIRRVIGVPQKREEITVILSECFSRDFIGIEEYEHRVGLAHAAATLDELEHLISDVPREVLDGLKQNAPAAAARTSGGLDLTVDHGVRKIDDQRLATRQLNLTAKGSVIKLRYNRVEDLPEEMVINADLVRSVVKITVPPEVVVTEQMDNSMSVVKYKRKRRYRGIAPRVRLLITGSVKGSVVKIRTRRR